MNPKELDAVISTAHATWALAILTFLAVVAAIFVPMWQRRQDRADERTRERERDQEAQIAIIQTVDVLGECIDYLQHAGSRNQFEIRTRQSRLRTQERILNHFLAPTPLGRWTPVRLSACMQAAHEMSDDLERANDDNPTRRAEAVASAKLALQRLEEALARFPGPQ